MISTARTERTSTEFKVSRADAVDDPLERRSCFVAWAEKGIVGRGILLDYHAWRLQNRIPYEPFESNSIPLEHLKAVAKAQGTEIKFGDILIIRSGRLF